MKKKMKAGKPAKKWGRREIAALIKENPEGFLRLVQAYGIETVAPSGRKRREDGLTNDLVAAAAEQGYKRVPSAPDPDAPDDENEEGDAEPAKKVKPPAHKKGPAADDDEGLLEKEKVPFLVTAACLVSMEKELTRGLRVLFEQAADRLMKISGATRYAVQQWATDKRMIKAIAKVLDHEDGEDAALNGLMWLAAEPEKPE